MEEEGVDLRLDITIYKKMPISAKIEGVRSIWHRDVKQATDPHCFIEKS